MWSRSRQQGGRSAVRSIRGKENILTIEHAIVRHKPKPWGSTDLRPWSRASTGDGPIGELWFERPGLVSSLAPGLAVPETALLLKLLFTSEPLSIQVHPDDRPEDYLRAADYLNSHGFEAVSLQHEFGIFGGEAGGQIMTLLSRLTIPIVTTLHTVLSEPTKVKRDVLGGIVAVSSNVVMLA